MPCRLSKTLKPRSSPSRTRCCFGWKEHEPGSEMLDHACTSRISPHLEDSELMGGGPGPINRGMFVPRGISPDRLRFDELILEGFDCRFQVCHLRARATHNLINLVLRQALDFLHKTRSGKFLHHKTGHDIFMIKREGYARAALCASSRNMGEVPQITESRCFS